MQAFLRRCLLFLLGVLFCCKAFCQGGISLNFQDIQIRDALQVIAEFAHINIISSDKVQGNMSIHLENISWQQALDIILQGQNLADKKINGAYYIAPLSSIEAENKTNDLKTEYFTLHYINTEQLKNVLNQSFSDIKINLDPRTATVRIQAGQTELAQIADLIKRIDVPMHQVLIEARIAVIDESALKEFGVVMGEQLQNGLLQRLEPNEASINLPVNNPAGTIGFRIARLPNGRAIDLELQALEAEGKGQIISSPELLVSDNQKAYIEQGQEIPFQTATSSGATQIEFKKAVLGLQVVPHIAEKNQVLLSLKVSDDAISNDESPAGEVPIVATSEIKTDVLVQNGQTVVLGGIHIEEVKHDKRGVPVLDNIPAIGWLFRHPLDVSRKTELVIFVTPALV